MKKLIIRQWGQIIFGLIIFSFGVHCTIFANIGLAPWDCLAMGLSYHLPLNYGMTVTLAHRLRDHSGRTGRRQYRTVHQ